MTNLIISEMTAILVLRINELKDEDLPKESEDIKFNRKYNGALVTLKNVGNDSFNLIHV